MIKRTKIVKLEDKFEEEITDGIDKNSCGEIKLTELDEYYLIEIKPFPYDVSIFQEIWKDEMSPLELFNTLLTLNEKIARQI